jgi:capsular polysaccharide biosynthesis protein
MTLSRFLLALRHRAWIPLAFAAIAVIASDLLIVRSKPTYTATATVIAKNPANATDRPLSFPEVVTSNNVAIRALKASHVDESVDQLEASLSVVSGKSDLYQLSIRDSDPARATALANAVANESTAYYQDLAGGDTASILATIDKDRADLSQRYLDASKALLAFDQAHPELSGGGAAARAEPALGAQRLALQLQQTTAANAVLNFEAGMTQGKLAQISTIRDFESHVIDQAAPIQTGGARYLRALFATSIAFLLGLAVVFVIEYFSHSINKPEEAEAYLDAPVVGAIPRINAGALRRLGGDK